MRRTRAKLRAATTAASAALLAGAAAPAPAATAVSPTTATAAYSCGTWGSTTLTLTAAQNGTTATITLGAPDMITSVAIPANTMDVTLRLEENGGPETTVFRGGSNPSIPAGSPVRFGALTGIVAPGDSLDSYMGGDSLSFTFSVFNVRCTAITKQSPGPFVFD
ncbi:hypothetical protein [Streptomyces sp. 11-1-2]|uniref:hypothetical protein n=1 Tax=unclassified Streptomyces TaxID=2593676 RepID=UPI000B8DA6D3|nr:hypothetical protein [Streptomyces sp. 11-1-2]ASQ91934.1 hypothetical protein CGL27_00900 [Streptomyces sp. 11-1-2]